MTDQNIKYFSRYVDAFNVAREIVGPGARVVEKETGRYAIQYWPQGGYFPSREAKAS